MNRKMRQNPKEEVAGCMGGDKAQVEIEYRRISVKHYAEETGKTIYTVRRWIAEGKVEAEKDPGGRDWIILVPRTGNLT